MNWTEGYVLEVNYTSGFYGELRGASHLRDE